MTDQEQELLDTDEYVCINLKIGRDRNDFVDGILPEPRRKRFENHLVFCRKCQEEVEYLRWVLNNLKSHEQRKKKSVGVTSVFDGNKKHLSYLYQPLSEQLAAAKEEPPADIVFPYVVEYADGQVIGEFRRRTESLYFYLKKSPKPCLLVKNLTGLEDLSGLETLEFREGEEKRIGLFQEIVSSETVQGMLEGIQRFQVVFQ